MFFNSYVSIAWGLNPRLLTKTIFSNIQSVKKNLSKSDKFKRQSFNSLGFKPQAIEPIQPIDPIDYFPPPTYQNILYF